MDMGYDNNRVYAECAERDCAAIIPLRRNQGERGNLKHNFGLAFLRVRGIERVWLPAALTMLGRLSLTLAQARALPLAA